LFAFGKLLLRPKRYFLLFETEGSIQLKRGIYSKVFTLKKQEMEEKYIKREKILILKCYTKMTFFLKFRSEQNFIEFFTVYSLFYLAHVSKAFLIKYVLLR
jgi:hypothetical protein